MWGQVPRRARAEALNRIIPTRVGTSCLETYSTNEEWDHPHACGDKTWSANTIFGIVGSSPRVWGQVTIRSNGAINSGIIPTRVGTSPVLIVVKISVEDHPHACGDKSHLTMPAKPRLGSSPRVWGQVLTDGEGNAKMRIIPTRVGTSFSLAICSVSVGDHPHACGDKGFRPCVVLRLKGSSPRVWGQGF